MCVDVHVRVCANVSMHVQMDALQDETGGVDPDGTCILGCCALTLHASASCPPLLITTTHFAACASHFLWPQQNLSFALSCKRKT